MTPRDLSAMLSRDVESVVHSLLPNGKREGNHWVVGSLGGEEGKSMKVTLHGNFAGKWTDFATGEHGDLIDLWMEARGTTIARAMEEIASYMGVTLERPNIVSPSTKSWAKPDPIVTVVRDESPVIAYLKGRGISVETQRKFRISEKGSNVIFPFYSHTGDLTLAKWRSIEDKKKTGVTKDCRPILFGWQAVSPKTRSIVICEGEIDAMSFLEYGIEAMSVPFGGGTGAKQAWIEHEFDNLQRFDDIVLAMDMDDVGHKASTEIVERIGRHRCRIAELPCKDINECLMSGVSRAAISEAISQAKSQDPVELRNVSEFIDDILREFNPTAEEAGFSLLWQKEKTIHFRPGEVTLLAGVNGHGKSEGMGHILLEAISQGEKGCVASLEFRPQRWLKRLVLQASGLSNPTDQYVRKIVDWMSPAIWAFDVATVAKADTLLEVFAYARRKYGITVFVIDNLSKLNIDLDDYNGQREFMDRLTDFAKQHNAHVFLVTHVRKGEDDFKPTGKMDIKGSGALTDLADTVIIWWRNRKKEQMLKKPNLSEPEREELEMKPDAMMICEKQRNGEDEPRINLWWHGPSHQFLSSSRGRPREYVRFAEGA